MYTLEVGRKRLQNVLKMGQISNFFSKFLRSWELKALPKDSIGSLWVKLSNLDKILLPTLCVGESGFIKSGYFFSRSISSWNNAS